MSSITTNNTSILSQFERGFGLEAESEAQLAAAGGLAAAELAAKAVETVAEGVRAVAAGAARGFAKVANAMSGVSQDGKQLSVRESHHAASPVSQKLGDAAHGEVQSALENEAAAWRAYAAAVEELARQTHPDPAPQGEAQTPQQQN